MFNPCLFISLSSGVKLVALVSMLCSVANLGTSSWVLNEFLKERNFLTAHKLLMEQQMNKGNTFYDDHADASLWDLDAIFRIYISASATIVVASLIQFLMSMWLLLASVKEEKLLTKIWVMVHICIIIGIGAGVLTILTNDLDVNNSTLAFLIVSGVNFVLLIYFCCVVFMYSYSKDNYNYTPV